MSQNSTWIRGISDANLKKLLAERAKLSSLESAAGAQGFVFIKPPIKVGNLVIFEPRTAQDSSSPGYRTSQ